MIRLIKLNEALDCVDRDDNSEKNCFDLLYIEVYD